MIHLFTIILIPIGCLGVSDAISVYNTLHTAQTNLILTNDLHLLIIVVPKTLIDSVRPDWKAYFEKVREEMQREIINVITKVSRLSPDEERVAQLYNINIGLLAGKYTGRSTKMVRIHVLQHVTALMS